ncbi:MAG TPA: hypothetical protein VG099_17875 [Gemmataceae bacterium]|jgi:hypothetical protein|nr:hypothetical protein [Gemmataceae bacterium]
MPRRKGNSGQGQRGHKSAAVRELLAQQPQASVKDIVAVLGSRGLVVNPNLVYLIKGKMKAQRRRQMSRQAVEAGRNAGLADPVELVRRVKELSKAAGGIHYLKQLLDVLAE